MKILIIEDDLRTANVVRDGLKADDHTVEIASDGAEGSFMARTFEYDAIVLDYSLPKKNGLEVCREVRLAGRTTPILFLSIVDDSDTKIAALNQGADDYMTKPFQLLELYARIRAVTRRPAIINKTCVSVDDLSIDTDRHIVLRGTTRIRMTRKEFNLLEYLMKNTGRVLSRALLMEHVWTADSNPFSNTVEAHIRNIRKKICINHRPDLIANIPGRGYVIDTLQNLRKL
ncbi:MAG: response regulator transcription factor [Candidatus Paceibacterota bacterium]|jgi:DNA-binding response OmpR family regulator